MQTRPAIELPLPGINPGCISVAICECGWRNEVPFRDALKQEAIVEAHWESVK
jgi:hypothetical protein